MNQGRAPGHPLLALTLDLFMAPLRRVREQVVPKASGDVLEVGLGTGLNLGLYEGLRSLTAIEPDPYMLRRARARQARLGVEARLEAACGEDLPYPDESFDTVVATFVLCTIPDPAAALREMRRVLRPEGRLLFAEHIASKTPAVRRVQDAVDPLYTRVAGGCHLNRETPRLLEEGGFVVEQRPHGSQRYALSPVVSGRGLKA